MERRRRGRGEGEGEVSWDAKEEEEWKKKRERVGWLRMRDERKTWLEYSIGTYFSGEIKKYARKAPTSKPKGKMNLLRLNAWKPEGALWSSRRCLRKSTSERL